MFQSFNKLLKEISGLIFLLESFFEYFTSTSNDCG